MEQILGSNKVIHSPRDSLAAEEFSGVFDFSKDVREDMGGHYTETKGADVRRSQLA